MRMPPRITVFVPLNVLLLAIVIITPSFTFALGAVGTRTARTSTSNNTTISNNPSGNCTADDEDDDNGSRPSFHIPDKDEGVIYLPNCQNPLKRELWRVFVKQDGTAYMMPRPDGLGVEYGMCDSGSTIYDGISSIRDKAELYGLCDPFDPINVNVNINGIAMDPADALEFSTIFHRQLQFHVDTFRNNRWMIPDEDILLACELLGRNRNMRSDTKIFCRDVEARCNDQGQGKCTKNFVPFTQETAEEIVPALNEIYGVKKQGDGCEPDVWGATFACPVAKCMAPPEGCTYTIAYDINDSNDCCEKLCYFVNSRGEECSSGGSTSKPLSIPILILPALFFLIPFNIHWW